MKDTPCSEFLQWSLPHMGLRWRGFRRVRRQVCKRLRRRIRELAFVSHDEYRAFLEANPGEWQLLEQLCRVTISRFWRDRALFAVLESEIAPGLVELAAGRGEQEVRCWCAGCAAGEEPYSLQILWQLGSSPRLQEVALRVVGTDLDPALLARAERHRYPASSLRELPAAKISRAFRRIGDEYRLRPAFQRGVEFHLQDIRRQLPQESFHLILCRNLVFTYMLEETQSEVLASVLNRLVCGGVLVLGIHERLPPGTWPLESLQQHLRIYRRDSSAIP